MFPSMSDTPEVRPARGAADADSLPQVPEEAENAERPNASTGSLRPALTFGVVMATAQMALLLWLLYC